MATDLDARHALDRHAPGSAAALHAVEGAVWTSAVAADETDTVDLVAGIVTAPHGLAPLSRPSTLGPSPWSGRAIGDWRAFGDLTAAQRVAAGFAEQFSLDVSAIDVDARVAIGGALKAATGDVVQAMWVLDYLPRVRAALVALFGPAEWPDADRPDGIDSDLGLWPAIDGYIHAVPALEHLDPVITELVRLRGARAHQCRLCQSLRSRPALRAGADDDDFAAVDHYQTSDLSPPIKAALAFTDAMIWLPGRIDPAVASAVRAELTDGQAVELVLDVARNATNKIAVAFAADAPHVDDGYEIYEITADGEAHYGLTLD